MRIPFSFVLSSGARLLVLLLLSGGAQPLIAQRNPVLNEVHMVVLTATYGVHLPGGQLADRFGNGFVFGGQTEWMTWPGNWIVGLDTRFGFAGEVKENVLAFLQDADGTTVGRDVSLSQAFLQQRMLLASAYVGKLIPVVAANKRSGIRLTLGGGYLRHWIKVNDEMRSLPQIEGPYGAGYDRLTVGPALTQFLGYQHISLSRRLNVLFGVDAMQGFTRSHRDYDYQNMSGDLSARLDWSFGVRAGLSVNLYSGSQQGDIYY